MRDSYICRTKYIKRGGKVKKHFHLFIDSFWLYRFTTVREVTSCHTQVSAGWQEAQKLSRVSASGNQLRSSQEFLHLAISSAAVKSFCIWHAAQQLSRVSSLCKASQQMSKSFSIHQSPLQLSRISATGKSVYLVVKRFSFWQKYQKLLKKRFFCYLTAISPPFQHLSSV